MARSTDIAGKIIAHASERLPPIPFGRLHPDQELPIRGHGKKMDPEINNISNQSFNCDSQRSESAVRGGCAGDALLLDTGTMRVTFTRS